MVRSFLFQKKCGALLLVIFFGKKVALSGGRNLAKSCTQKFENGHIYFYLRGIRAEQNSYGFKNFEKLETNRIRNQ